MKYHVKKFKKKERNVNNIVPFHSLQSILISLITSTALHPPSPCHINHFFYFQYAMKFIFGSSPTPHQRSPQQYTSVRQLVGLVAFSSIQNIRMLSIGSQESLPQFASIFPNSRNFLRLFEFPKTFQSVSDQFYASMIACDSSTQPTPMPSTPHPAS